MFGGDPAYSRGKMPTFSGRYARIACGSGMFGGDLAYCRGKMGNFGGRHPRIARGSPIFYWETLRIVVVK